MHDFQDFLKKAKVIILKRFKFNLNLLNQRGKYSKYYKNPFKGFGKGFINITIIFFLFFFFATVSFTQIINFGSHITVPVVASAKGGYGSDWRSDVWIHNADGGKEAIINMWYVPPGTQPNPSKPDAIVRVPSFHTICLEDIVKNTFNKEGVGSLFMFLSPVDENGVGRENADPKKIIVESNVYNRVDEIKQYGQQLPGIREQEYAKDGETHYLPGSPDTTKYRANLGVVTLNATQFLLTFRNAGGNILHQEWYDLPQYSFVQFNDIIKTFNLPDQNRIYVEVRGNGKIITYMSHVDKKTNDGSIFLGRTISSTDPYNWFPGVARAEGAQGSKWRSSYFVINPNYTYRLAGVCFIPAGEDGFDKIICDSDYLSPLSDVAYEDILLNKLGIEEGVGGMRASSYDTGQGQNSLKVINWMRTYNSTEEGTYGQSIPGKGWLNKEMIRGLPLYIDPSLEQWNEIGFLVGVRHDDYNRANLIFQNTATDRDANEIPIDVILQIVSNDGKVLGEKAYWLNRGEYRQINRFVEDILGEGAKVTDATVRVMIPYTIRFDNWPDPYNYTAGGLDVRVSVVNGNRYQGTNDGRLITFQKIDFYVKPADNDYWGCNEDPVCERAVEYVSIGFDVDCDPNEPLPGLHYDPDQDGKCAPPWFYLSNKEVRSMIKGCDPQGTTGYVCGVQTGMSVPSYARQMAEILARANGGLDVNEVEQWLYNHVDDNLANGELDYGWDPLGWIIYGKNGTEVDRVRFYLMGENYPEYDYNLPSLRDALDFYDLTKKYLIKTVMANPDWYCGNAEDGPNFEYDPAWYTYTINYCN